MKLNVVTILIQISIIYQNFKQTNAQTADIVWEPCENFYQYACSNYAQEHTDPNYSEITQQLDYELNRKLLTHLKDAFLHHNYHPNIQTYYDKMGLYLESCNNESRRSLLKYFDELRPSTYLYWPLLGPFKERWLRADIHFDFWSLLGEMQSYGLNNVIVNQQAIRNADNSLTVWLAPPTLDQEASLPETQILQVLLAGLGIQDTTVIIQQLQATDLEWQRLMKNFSDNTETEEMSLPALQQLYPQLNLKLYLQKLLPGELYALANVTLQNPQYFEYLSQKMWTAEQLEQLCNYLMLKFLFYLAVDSTAEFTRLECLKDLRRKFDLAVNYIAYKHLLNRKADSFESAVLSMLDNIKAIIAKYFQENHLNLSEQQIDYLKTKLANVKVNIGNLPLQHDSIAVQAFYQNIPLLDRHNYYKNHLLLLKHRFRKSLTYSQRQTHYIVTDNRMGAVSSPFYVAQQNMVVIPVGSLQLPFFSYSQTPLQQLAVFGFVLAHELTHAFDSAGLNYDQWGYLMANPSDILDHDNFTNSLDCMLQQQPTEEIDERLADLFAVHVAYRTYLEYYANRRLEADWSKEFFVNLAQFFCGKNNVRFIDHDSDAIRLQQIVMNFQPFSAAFGCAEGSAMHPKAKCRLY